MANETVQDVQTSPAEALNALPAGNNSRDVLEALSQMIESSGLKIGDRLPTEIAIAQRLGIGRSKVREALTAWQNMGIVVRNKKAGTWLAAEVFSNSIHLPVTLKLEVESLLRTHAVRRPLEIEAVRIATLNCSEQDRWQISARGAELMASYEANEDWRPADHRFHAAIHTATRNPLFGQLIQQIQQAFKQVYETPFGQPHLGQASIPLHVPLGDAIIAGRSSEAVRITEEIMDIVEDEIRQVMERHDA